MIDDVGSPSTPAALHLLPLRLYHPGVPTRDLVLAHKTDLPVTEGHVPQPWPVPLTNQHAPIGVSAWRGRCPVAGGPGYCHLSQMGM